MRLVRIHNEYRIPPGPDQLTYSPRLEFSREWNIPVHHFLRRHVYFPSKTRFSQSVAMFITFLVSSIAHELVMSCITKKLRGYGFVAMMLQLPIVAVQQSKYFRGKTTLRVSTNYSPTEPERKKKEQKKRNGHV